MRPLEALQSALSPAGPQAAAIGDMTIVLAVGSAAIFAVVMGLALHALLRGSRRASARTWLLGGGIVFPTVVLTALLVYAIAVTAALSTEPSDGALTVRVIGKRWWWEVRYPGPAGDTRVPVTSANEIHIPAGRPVTLLLESDDVIHSLWVPALGGKIDMIPGRVNRLVVHAERPGVYRGQCAEYCGAQHAHMALYVIAHDPAEFARRLEYEAQPAAAATGARRGEALFTSAGCAVCHTVRGTAAAGRLGPDLTHVASRVSLAAGILDVNRATVAGWIANSQALKPGNLMPPAKLAADELHALTDYILSLK